MIDIDLQEYALRLRSSGFTFQRVGEVLGVTRTTAYDICAGNPLSLAACNVIRRRLGWAELGEMVLLRPGEEVRKRPAPRPLSPSQQKRRQLQAQLKELGITLNDALELAIAYRLRGDT